ncbi:ABC transporter ATP-binding protein [uncultured Dialister sp.]|uniref:ABC transporter ATP-binding protein n=1 Tax=uncultured Dialister sp. TaxID=278064 RepID=UPI0025931AF5|nr:dipeptide/oligopeptide/nickel ABC transporter ATP-binding protein [uncultured Dialister sp.]
MKGYGEEILRMEDIVKTFDLGGGKKLTASDHVTISLHKGETLGIVGESGSGKSTLAKILTRHYTMDSGCILLHGKDMTALKGGEFRQARKNIQMVFQDPSTAFDPKQRVRDIICEPLMNYGLIGKEKVDEKAREMLRLVDLPEEFADRYPNSMSGGQRQRIAVARALVLKPEIIICDEATSALDMSVQKTVIELLHRLQLETGVAYFFICHDLALANMFCDNIVVMQHGRVVEKIKDLSEAKDPYSRKLLASVFTIEEGKNKVLPDELFG